MSPAPRPSSGARSNKQNGITAGVQQVEEDTHNYNYGDFAVELLVGDQVFKVSSSRLAQHSPVFKEMFTLPQPAHGAAITLHNDADEFRDFLWYIHADPFSAKEFLDAPSSSDKCLRLLGIANVAHMYDAETPARRAQDMALTMLTAQKRPFSIDIALALRILRVAARETGSARRRCVDIVCDAMYPRQVAGPKGRLEVDPISVVELARETEDLDVLAHAYFYVLMKGDAYWEKDNRLTAADRRRLLCGSHTLYGPHRRRQTSGASWDGWAHATVHPDIKQFRSTLWGCFDDRRWALDDDSASQPSGWPATRPQSQTGHTGSAAHNGSDNQGGRDVFLEFLLEFASAD